MSVNRLMFLVLLLAGCGEPASDPVPVIEVPDIGVDLGLRDDAGDDGRSDIPAVEPTLTLLVEDAQTGELAERDNALWGEQMVVRVEGLSPGSEIELVATMYTYSTSASFVADDQGVIDTANHAPVAGNWDDADADALTWSMSSDSPGYGQTADDLTVHVEVTGPDELVLSGAITRSLSPDGVQVIEVDEPSFDGTLYVPDGDGPHPVLITLGGSEGGSFGAGLTAGRVVRMGYAALAVAYFGTPDTPAQLENIPLEYFESALEWLADRDGIDTDHIGVYGGSRGGELALLLGATYPDYISAVVAAAPSGLLWGSVSVADTAAWSLDGEPLPYVRSHGGMPSCDDEACAYTPAFRTDIDNAPAAELADATIAVENIVGPVLLYGGDDDLLWPSCELADISWARLSNGHTNDYADVNLCIPDAGHGISEPGWSTQDSDLATGSGSTPLRIGGTQDGNGRAGRVVQNAVRDFLRDWSTD